jgi:hypothetical protein
VLVPRRSSVGWELEIQGAGALRSRACDRPGFWVALELALARPLDWLIRRRDGRGFRFRECGGGRWVRGNIEFDAR